MEKILGYVIVIGLGAVTIACFLSRNILFGLFLFILFIFTLSLFVKGKL